MPQDVFELFSLINSQKNMHLIPGATDMELAEFEKINGVVLPHLFKAWLKLSDGGDLYLPAGVQLYGVVHNPIIDINEVDKPGDDYVVIGALSNGDPVVFRKGEEQISIYNHECDRIEDDETYPDFCSFLDDLSNLLGVGG